MSAEKSLFLQLYHYPEVRAIVNDQSYRDIAPQGIREPFVICTGISSVPDAYMSGQESQVTGTFQVDVYASSADERDRLADAVRNALGGIVRKNVFDTYINSCVEINEVSSVEPYSDGTDLVSYRRVIEFEAQWHRDFAPDHAEL